MGVVHLHRHSDFSLLDGIGTAELYAKRAAELGQEALALTDHGSLAGVLYHVEACEKVGVKPIVGMEAYFRPNIQADRENRNTYGYFHLVLLAKNQEGFKNLMRLSSDSYSEDNFYQKPCVDWKLLRKFSNGLIASSSCLSGLLPRQFMSGDTAEAQKTLRIFQDIFGDDFYLETQPHDIEEQRKVNLELIGMANKFGIPVVAAIDAHYPMRGWHDTQDVSLMISTGSSLSKRKQDEEQGRDYMKFSGDTFWLMSEEEIKDSYQKYHSDIPFDVVETMISNSVEIANRCEDFKYDKSRKIPKATDTPEEAEAIIRSWCEEGLERIGKSSDVGYTSRVEDELSVIKELGVTDYFVIVGSTVRWAKENGIRVGPGRGSAAGSLINYLIGITAIDPMGYGLLFERFLNKYRTELPDIDIDFQDDRRDEVKEYLKHHFGDEHVVEVSAFQSFGHKGVIQDVCRVLDIPYMDAKRVTDLIPPAPKLFGKDLEDLEKDIPELKQFFEKYPEVRKHSLRLFGQMKGTSKHAAAVIVTDRPAHDLIPMMRSKDGGMVTQWSERANGQLISPYGFLKIDCLSTDSLTIQDRTIKLIEERHGVKIDFEDPKQFPFIESPLAIEKNVIDSFAMGANIGIFQFGSAGVVGLIKGIVPENLEHLVAANALYRPGTLENKVAFQYAQRKNGARWKIPHESVKEILGGTYGFMIYQEQVMQIYRTLAKDATPEEAADFLKVVAKGVARDLDGKKKLQKYKEKFVDGCIEKGIPESSYEELWSQILQMTTYSFNKSHSAGYAVQAYQDMWLKTKYPLEFYTSLLTIETEKTSEIIKESKKFGIRILPPDINTSDIGFTIDGNSIRFGLMAIKNVGPSAAKEIIDNRPFESFEDLLRKVAKGKVNKKVKNALFSAGALDRFGARDSWVLDDDGETRISNVLSVADKAGLEKEYTGFAISRKDDVERFEHVISDTIDDPETVDGEDGREVCVGGEIVTLKEILTKKNDKMAFATLSFKDHDFDLTIFPDQYTRYMRMLEQGNAILALGSWDKERRCVVVNNICTAEQLAMES